jgi:hypothetical protein
MKFDWLTAWLAKDKKIRISLPSFAFTWPNAERDVCKVCGVTRKYHFGSEHRFFEEKRTWL